MKIKSGLTGFAVLAGFTLAGMAHAAPPNAAMLSNACAGHSLKDGQEDAFIALPKGTCERIVGGRLEAPRAEAQ